MEVKAVATLGMLESLGTILKETAKKKIPIFKPYFQYLNKKRQKKKIKPCFQYN
jgi:hypothetical protein